MSLKRIFSIMSLLLSACAGNAFAVCPGDLYFKQPTSQQLSVPVGYAALGDVDGDGRKDLVGFTMSTQRRTNPVNLVVYKRSATGFDIAPVVTNVGSSFDTDGFDMIDTNNDGKLDIINFGNPGSGDHSLTTYLGDGNGGFTLGASTVIGYLPYRSFGDVNGDGRPDLIASWSGNTYLSLMQADGTFGQITQSWTGTFGFIRDFNNDGKNDILIWYFNATEHKILYNQGNATFTQGPAFPNVAASFLGDIKDLNGDGRLDFVTATYISGGNAYVAVYLGQSAGGFTVTEKNLGPTTTNNPGWPAKLADANGDGDSDLIVFGFKSFSVGTNNGAGQFTMATRQPSYDVLMFGGNLPPALDDFNGDGRADLISVNRELVFKNMADVVKVRQNTCTPFGQTKFVDFDGDDQTDLGYFRASDGTWLYRGTRTDSNVSILGFGTTGDIPVPQDYDGDAFTNRAFFHPSTGTWHIMDPAGGISAVQWGLSGDKPVPSDFDGDGKANVAIYRPSNGTWWILNSSNGSYDVYTFGISEDIPVPMDYDGDGRSDAAVYRPSTGVWYIQKSSGGYFITPWGTGTDIPIPGDYDNDGHADLAVYRSNGQWWVYRLRDNQLALLGIGGGAGDVPVPITRDVYGTNVAVYRPTAEQLWEANQYVQSFTGFGNNKIVSTILPN